MIPNRQQCLILWDKFKLPSEKRIHVEEVTKLALYLASKFVIYNSKLRINKDLIQAAAMLHDIDKNIKPKEEERHPDTAVRVLNELGLPEVAETVKKHPLHAILDPKIMPQTWEEKIVYLADKMTKYEIIGVDHRFGLWYKENLSQNTVTVLKQAYPQVKKLEAEIYSACKISWHDIEKDLLSKIK
jgi:putative nucleotidyltransferase with HDIG domain